MRGSRPWNTSFISWLSSSLTSCQFSNAPQTADGNDAIPMMKGISWPKCAKLAPYLAGGRGIIEPVLPRLLTSVTWFHFSVSSIPAIDQIMTKLIRLPPITVQCLHIVNRHKKEASKDLQLPSLPRWLRCIFLAMIECKLRGSLRLVGGKAPPQSLIREIGRASCRERV